MPGPGRQDAGAQPHWNVQKVLVIILMWSHINISISAHVHARLVDSPQGS